ncbi:MAG: DMT family transporter [Bacteroidales bacterium]|nr:DMT family transporter [Bacteroidales bacterium]
MNRREVIFNVVALSVVAVWGVTFVSSKVLLSHGLLPAQIFLLRFIIAYVGLWLVALALRKGQRVFSKSLRDELMFVLLGITGGSVYFLAENTALVHTQACNVSFLVSSAPLLTLLLTLLAGKLFKGRITEGLEKVRLNRNIIIGTLLALGGMAAVIFDGASLSFSPKGDLLAIAAALCWALYSIILGHLEDEYGSLFTTRKVFFYGLLTILPSIIAEGSVDFGMVIHTPAVLLNILFLGIVASLGCFLAWNKAMSELGNVSATNYVYLNPFFTLIFAVIFLGERMTPVSALGSLAIVCGVALASRRKILERNRQKRSKIGKEQQ